MNTAILLGAGSSVAAGFPSTQDLTELVLSGCGVSRHTDRSYNTGGATPPTEATLLANLTVRRLHEKAELYYSAYKDRQTHYEDLFYLARQASDDLAGELENPAVHPFVNELKADMSPLIEAEKAKVPGISIQSFPTLLRETCNYIADVVWCRLCREPASQSHLDVIARACNCNSVNVTSISTLCHDTHVETFLRAKGIALSDGFSEPQAGVRYWNSDLSSSGKTPFLKLHGSVDWFRLRPLCGGDGYDTRIGIPVDGDYYHTKTADGKERQWPEPGRPMLLIGTFNKISQYSSGIFLDLRWRFRSTIGEASQMVVCGYGFGDKGINTEITAWYERGRRLVIIHPDPDSLVANARGAIHKIWPEWRRTGSISIIKKRFEEVDCDEFMAAICT